MPTAADTAKLATLAAVRAAFNGEIEATDRANKLLNAAIKTGKYPELIPLQNGARVAVADLNRYSAIIRAAVEAAGGVAALPAAPVGVTNLRTEKFYPGADALAAAMRDGLPDDKYQFASGGVYRIDLSADGKAVPVTVTA